jgi:type VI secretion system protein ImpM
MSAGFGLFGKLPAKRDFVSSGIPQAVLSPWENWLQQEIAQSRLLLDREWIQIYLRAPIWRFTLGSRLLGRSAIGVLMPCVDGVGRYFPLTILALAEEGQAFPSPDDQGVAAIFENIESRILGALEADCDYDAFLSGLRALVPPSTMPQAHVPATALVSTPLADPVFELPYSAVTAWWNARAAASSSCWWTLGGEGFPPRMIGCEGLPRGPLFAAMLSGRFGEKDAAS